MADRDEVVLVGFWTSPYVMRVKIALAEKGVHYLYLEEENIFQNKSPFLLKVNPVRQKVPVLIHDDKLVWESLIILQYIDDVRSQKPLLLSQDPYRESKVRFWVDFFDNKIAEGELGEKPYFEGDRFGLLDVALAPFACRFHTYEMFRNFSVEKECPKIMEWVKRCSLRETVSKTLPDKYKSMTLSWKSRRCLE